MKKILINLISEQTIPNILLIKELPEMDEYIFVATEKMINSAKIQHIKKATQLNKPSRIIVVKPDNYFEIKSKLSPLVEEFKASAVHVNLTGGTKIMSLSTMETLRILPHSRFLYLPIHSNCYHVLYPESEEVHRTLTFRINAADYLNGYGIEIKSSCLQNHIFARKKSTFLLYHNRHSDNSKIESFVSAIFREARTLYKRRKKMKDKPIGQLMIKYPEESLLLAENKAKLSAYLKHIEWGTSFEQLSKKDIEYLSTGWFEEYIFLRVCEALRCQADSILGSVQIVGANVPNELDVFLVHENTPVIIECKTGFGKENVKQSKWEILKNAIYKLEVLKKTMGFSTKGFIFTLDDILSFPEEHRNRAAELDITFVNQRALDHPLEWQKIIQKIQTP